ncbi:hypothetical protein CYMTET_35124 [Cymbomonas tetramitiformis]|uniref:Uncharacterized protein n=1 Tax=Cymbomonas tetramitiformis TaxID=36881 RepID=A0AAE0KP77_9CHLO|nr:hypothetical protein CYMTET_35124 [Cymbomonas tetramitiformis]
MAATLSTLLSNGALACLMPSESFAWAAAGTDTGGVDGVGEFLTDGTSLMEESMSLSSNNLLFALVVGALMISKFLKEVGVRWADACR